MTVWPVSGSRIVSVMGVASTELNGRLSSPFRPPFVETHNQSKLVSPPLTSSAQHCRRGESRHRLGMTTPLGFFLGRAGALKLPVFTAQTGPTTVADLAISLGAFTCRFAVGAAGAPLSRCYDASSMQPLGFGVAAVILIALLWCFRFAVRG